MEKGRRRFWREGDRTTVGGEEGDFLLPFNNFSSLSLPSSLFSLLFPLSPGNTDDTLISTLPETPARPERPLLVSQKQMPNAKEGTVRLCVQLISCYGCTLVSFIFLVFFFLSYPFNVFALFSLFYFFRSFILFLFSVFVLFFFLQFQLV